MKIQEYISEYNLTKLPVFYNPPKYTDRELLSIFPEGKDIINEKQKEYENELSFIKKTFFEKLILIHKIFKNDPFFDWFYSEWEEIKIKKRVLFLEKRLKYYEYIQYIIRNPERITENSIEKEDIQRAKEEPIEYFYDGNLKKSGDKLSGKCPFHNEKLGSFFIYLNTNTFHCFGCGKTGDVITFIMEYNNISFIEAVKYILKKR